MGPSKKKCQVSSKCFPELSEEKPCKNKINAVKNKIRVTFLAYISSDISCFCFCILCEIHNEN
ncbi:hypothetical protein MUK42_01596 [Musa troglodytarum]|uniref:Uncharacterized protein n=1 Tax=Musa troglodytarum TaxID=320322 RepID=A0A9E7GKF3_9LILI|nr:hypothetical protein MUK42_01596 [Musa troglodytarum]